ncbi:CLUMA_CG021593, isoform A [Clunio marinus]|uniref:CLUMA_CG021593, isoform A n=1 Tax=Clunio marinus TaxID=568069 RepID=A0A1J1JAX2_9DIPT|nr:CLUMA_CG021593, isoform A [Clunio marinus]
MTTIKALKTEKKISWTFETVPLVLFHDKTTFEEHLAQAIMQHHLIEAKKVLKMRRLYKCNCCKYFGRFTGTIPTHHQLKGEYEIDSNYIEKCWNYNCLNFKHSHHKNVLIVG